MPAHETFELWNHKRTVNTSYALERNDIAIATTFRHCPRTEQNISCFGAQKYVKHDPVHLVLKNCLSIKRNPKIYTNGKP